MSAMRKAIQYLGFDVSQHEEYDYADEELAPVTNLHDVSEVREKHDAHARASRSERHRAPGSSVSATDLRRIQTIKPRTYNDARLIGEAFRQGVPVIMNLTEMSDADAKRLVDFSACTARSSGSRPRCSCCRPPTSRSGSTRSPRLRSTASSSTSADVG